MYFFDSNEQLTRGLPPNLTSILTRGLPPNFTHKLAVHVFFIYTFITIPEKKEKDL